MSVLLGLGGGALLLAGLALLVWALAKALPPATDLYIQWEQIRWQRAHPETIPESAPRAAGVTPWSERPAGRHAGIAPPPLRDDETEARVPAPNVGDLDAWWPDETRPVAPGSKLAAPAPDGTA